VDNHTLVIIYYMCTGLCCNFDDYANFTEGESRYCAGELINGDAGTQDFSKADVYSLGASLYEMCAGEPLSAGSQENSSQWHDLRKGIFFREKHNIRLSLDSLSKDECSAGVITDSQNPVWTHYPEDLLTTLQQVGRHSLLSLLDA
jgi:serine/threonine protein kinase